LAYILLRFFFLSMLDPNLFKVREKFNENSLSNIGELI